MTQYQVDGMTCGNCVNTVKGQISGVDGVKSVDIDLESGVVYVEGSAELVDLQAALAGHKYHIHDVAEEPITQAKSSLSRLYPLFLVFAFLLGSVLINQWLSGTWDMRRAMLNFMGGFFVVFSFFKLLDLRGFVDSFRTYDPIAKRVGVYAWVYPFVELLQSFLEFTRQDLPVALIEFSYGKVAEIPSGRTRHWWKRICLRLYWSDVQ